jgi:GTP-binding protein
MVNTLVEKPAIQGINPLRPIVAIVGRPNVGKSTLFNRLLGERWTITDDRPGVTRDRIYAEAEWQGHRFTLVDTGGYISNSDDAIEASVRDQAERAIEEADFVLLICDAMTGATDLDHEIATILRKRQSACMLVVNKVDDPGKQYQVEDFYRLGLGDPVCVSATTGRRSGDLLEMLVQQFDAESWADPEDDAAIRVVIAGRPNVGKSTLTNRLAGNEVSIVHDKPGTTRDAINFRLAWNEHEFILVDTAGLRRRSKIDDQIEYYSGLRATKNMDKADVAVVLIDAVEGYTTQDARIMGLAIERGCGLLVAVNKWDIINLREDAGKQFLKNLHRELPYLVDYPVVFMSGLTGRKVDKCLENVVSIYQNRQTRVSTPVLNRSIEKMNQRHLPTKDGREIKILYATQLGNVPPTFSFFSNHPELISDSYKRFVEKNLRQEFGFKGSPIRMFWRRRRKA